VKKIKVFFTGVIFLGASFPFHSHAQDTTKLSLQEALQLSIKNSKQLKASAARNEQAKGALKEAKDNRLPNATFGGSYLRLASPHVSLKTKAFGSADSSRTPSVN